MLSGLAVLQPLCQCCLRVRRYFVALGLLSKPPDCILIAAAPCPFQIFHFVDYPCMNVSRFSLGHLHFSAKLYFHSCRLLRDLTCGVSLPEYVWCVLGLGVMVTVVSLSKAEHLFIFFCAIFTLVVPLTACLIVSPSFSLHSVLSVSVSGLAATKYPDYTTYPQADRNLMACISRVCYLLQPVTALIIQCFWLLHYVAQNVWGILMRGLGNGFVYLFSLIIFWGKVQNWEHWPKMLHLCLHKEAWQIVSSLMFLCLCDFFWPRGHSSLWQNCK